MKKSFLFAVMMLASTVGAAAAQADETSKPQDAKPQEEKKICRTEKVTGSLTARKRICLTQAEWDQLAAETAKGHRDYIHGAAGAGGPPANPGAPGF